MNSNIDQPETGEQPSSNGGRTVPRLRIGAIGLSIIALVALTTASWAFILLGRDSGFGDLLSGETWRNAGEFVGKLAGKGTGDPAFAQVDRWDHTGKLAMETLAMSVLAIAFASAGVLLTFLPAARNVAMGELAPAGKYALWWKGLYFVVRGIFVLTRGVPELIMAMVIVFFLSPGILPGALALGLHNYGILGKLSAEVVEDLDIRPARALRASGAGSFQMLAYAIMPQVVPQFITYLLYRWEVVVRTAIVVGFVSSGGLGHEFRLSMSFFYYTDVALLLIWYVLLVIGVDLLCGGLRRLVRH